MSMKQLLIAIFAHPDDEAFGPSGTLLKLKDDGYDIHLILLTDGEAGTNPDNVPDLGSLRLQEWYAASAILGATSTYALHLPDGKLERVDRRTLGETVTRHIYEILATYSEPVDYTYMTFEPQGLTGHRDHIVASRLTTKLAEHDEGVTVWYYCLDSTQAPLDGTTYYEPRAREDEYITNRIDVSAYLTDKYRMIDAHASQQADGTNLKALGEERLSVECFRIEVY